MKLQWGSYTDTGMVRQQNEDALLAEPGLFAVADGMGGHNAGEVASAIAITTLRAALRNGVGDHDQLRELIQQANTAIYTASLDDSTQRGMGTTLTAVAVVHGHHNLVLVANVGDSRTYLLRAGVLERVTLDHSYVQELVNEGVISIEEARQHPRKNIVTRALGIDRNVTVDITPLSLVQGDRLLLSSDGLFDEIPDDEIGAILTRQSDPTMCAEMLVLAANAAGGHDNTSVVVVDVLGDDEIVPVDNIKPVASPSIDVLAAIESIVANEDSSTVSGKRRYSLPKLPKVKMRFGPALFWGSIIAIVVCVLIAVGVFARTGFFLDADSNGNVNIYRGRPGGVLWFDPTLSQRGTVSLDQLPEVAQREVKNHHSFSSSSAAMRYLQSMAALTESTTTTTESSTTTVR